MSIVVFVWLVYTLLKRKECIRSEMYYYDMDKGEENMIVYNERMVINNESARKKTVPKVYLYNNNMPLIFVGGVAGSGLELVRAILNQNEHIRCTSDTYLLIRMITRRFDWTRAKIEQERLRYASMTDELMDAAVGAFVLEILLKHGELKDFICNKDMYMFNKASYLKSLFPKSKFLLVVRDARATVNSLMYGNHKYEQIRVNNYREALTDWNNLTQKFYTQCQEIGFDSCKIVFYEKLVLDTQRTLKDIFSFLKINSSDFKIARHKNNVDTLINNKVIIKADHLFSWLNYFPKDLLYVADKFAPMMRKLGYDTTRLAPNNLTYINLIN